MRVKLTLYYLALLTAVLGFFGAAVYAYINRSLVTIIDNSLSATATGLERRMRLTEPIEEPFDPNHEEEMMIAPLIVQVINAAGEITDEQSSLKAHPLPANPQELTSIQDDALHFMTASLPSGEQIRVATQRARDPEGHIIFLRVGQSLIPLQRARRQLVWLLVLAGPTALLLGSYGGLLLANQALNPVDKMTRAAKEIEAGDLSKRVPVPAKMDELGRLAVTFNGMIARLQAAFERQRQFTGDASHELRTPLAVMRGDIEIALRRERTEAEYKSVLTSNLEEIIRLSHLVEDLLMLARADAGQSIINAEPMRLDSLCAQVVEYLSPLAGEKNQAFTFDGTTEQPLMVNADSQRLKQMLLNLLDNAIKYTQPGGRITLSLFRDGSEAVIKIIDNGRGIPAEDLPHIFDRFFRHSRNTSDKGAPGSGLGLSIVKWIVDAHHGHIKASSATGGGTVFEVRLPAAA